MSTLITCPQCQKTEKASLAAPEFFTQKMPLPGDVSICPWCGVMLRFDEAQQWRVATPEEIKTLPFENRLELGRMRLAIELNNRRG